MPPESERESRRLWIVSPVFNDVPSFRKLRERVGEVLAENGLTDRYSPHFVILDDSAGLDPEIASVRELDDVTVIEPPFNLGHQRAIVFAVRVIAPDMDDEDSIVTMDADGEDRPEDIPRLLAALDEAPDANRRIVLALRTKRSETRTFKVFYLLFRTAFRLLTGMVVRWGNFAAFRGSVARRLFDHPQLNLCYSSTLALLDVERTLVPCARGSRYAGRVADDLLAAVPARAEHADAVHRPDRDPRARHVLGDDGAQRRRRDRRGRDTPVHERGDPRLGDVDAARR